MTDTDYSLPGFQTFLLPRVEGQRRFATLVRNTLSATRINNPMDCRERNEVLGVRLTTRNNEVALYNVFRNQHVDFMVGELQ